MNTRRGASLITGEYSNSKLEKIYVKEWGLFELAKEKIQMLAFKKIKTNITIL
jgi:hypothetical protein